MKELWELFLMFSKIGVLMFGGGYAILPLIQQEVVDKRGWATEEEILNYYAVGQCTPGVIAVNTATFIGYKRKGVIGGFVATAGVIFPSLVIIMVIARFIKNFAQLQVVQYAFNGIRIAVAALILNTIIGLWKSGIKDVTGVIIFACALLPFLLTNISPIIVVVAAIVAGIAIGKVRGNC